MSYVQSLPGYSIVSDIKSNYIIRNFFGGIKLMIEDKVTLAFFLILISILLLGLFGPMVAPYEADQPVSGENGIKQVQPPSLQHPMGTTFRGNDVFSLVLIGARPTVITGLLGGSMIITIGLSVGLTAGYLGGRAENLLMRLTDFVYGIPLIPFAIVLVTFLGVGFIQSIVVIGLILWRGSSRVIRSQTLQIKEHPYVLSAKATGAGTPHIVFKHILPNVAPMAILFFAMGVGYSIIIQAGLAFLGVADPFTPTWGVMIRNAFNSGYMGSAWWWSVPPGLLIGITVLSTFMFGRGYESLSQSSSNRDVDVEAFSG